VPWPPPRSREMAARGADVGLIARGEDRSSAKAEEVRFDRREHGPSRDGEVAEQNPYRGRDGTRYRGRAGPIEVWSSSDDGGCSTELWTEHSGGAAAR